MYIFKKVYDMMIKNLRKAVTLCLIYKGVIE